MGDGGVFFPIRVQYIYISIERYLLLFADIFSCFSDSFIRPFVKKNSWKYHPFKCNISNVSEMYENGGFQREFVFKQFN